MLQTIAMLNKFAKDAGVTEPSLLNFAVTDGHAVIATRYISSKTDEAASLYFSYVSLYCCMLYGQLKGMAERERVSKKYLLEVGLFE